MNDNKHRIAFFGSDEIALPFLRRLGPEGIGLLSAVLTQPDRRSGRGRKVQMNPIKQWAVEHDMEFRDPAKPSAEETRWLKALGIEMVLVMAYGHILKSDLIEFAPSGCFNLHASLLPAYRGASPIETALALGEEETGVTLMRVVPRMDAGPVVDWECVSIEDGETGSSLREKIGQACIPLVERNLGALLECRWEEKAQDDGLATYCRKLTKCDGFIDFNSSADSICRRVQAFRSWPSVSFCFGDQRIRIGKSSTGNASRPLVPGEVVLGSDGNLSIGTGTDSLVIHELQKPGGKMLPVRDFLRGFKIPDGTILESESMDDLLVREK